MKKVLVFATSFLDDLKTHPKDEGKAKNMLDELAGKSDGEIKIEYRCNRNPLEPLRTEEFENVVAVIADLEKYDREFLSKVGKAGNGSLGIIARYGIGFSSIDLDAATEYGIMVTNAPGCNALPTAEWTQAVIMSVAGRTAQQYKTASLGQSKEGPSRLDISGKTLGVIGTGTIGKHVIKLMQGFDVNVIAYDLFPDHEWAEKNNVKYTDLDILYKQSDIITIHASCSEQIVGEKEIELMKPSTILVNCARGILVDNRAAYQAVKEGCIFGYGLDEVWEEKDLSLDGHNIIVSSHVGSDTDAGKIGMQLMSAQPVVDYLNGIIPQHIVNKNILEKVNV